MAYTRAKFHTKKRTNDRAITDLQPHMQEKQVVSGSHARTKAGRMQ